jgi:hypothetical protein
MSEKTWEFTVIGCDPNDIPSYLGFFGTYEGAAEFRGNMELVGWRRVAVFDAGLREVPAPPST